MGLASFLIGDVTNMSRYVSVSTNAKETQKRMFTYMQDSWRITPKLTVNYGLRWELYFPETVNGKGQGGFPRFEHREIRVAGLWTVQHRNECFQDLEDVGASAWESPTN